MNTIYCQVCGRDIPTLGSPAVVIQFHAHAHASESFPGVFEDYRIASNKTLLVNRSMRQKCFPSAPEGE